MYYGTIKKHDIANGEGVRVSLFVSGCIHHCKGCFNQETWDFDYGQEFTLETEVQIMEAMSKNFISGLSLLGGEPFVQQNRRRLLPFLIRVKEEFPKKSIWCYTGYVFETELLVDKEAVSMLKQIDILVDGRYVEEKRNINLAFRGSDNQRIIDAQNSLKQKKTVLWKLE